MADQPIMLIEKLWLVKRKIDKGACPSVPFVHLNTLLREPGYRRDVLIRAENDGDRELQALASEILTHDTGQPLVAKSTDLSLQDTKPQPRPSKSRNGRRNLLALIPVFMAGGAAVVGFTTFENRAVRISSDITTDTTWEAGNRYVLENTVFVQDGASLTIQPGVVVQGERGSALIVTRDSQLFARGQAERPIVFTSSQSEGSRARGDWGGIVLLGSAPVNQPDAAIEGLSQSDQRGRFGGDDPDDSCGVLEYTRIEFAGFEVYQDNELNGLTLGGCGRSSIIRNVQVHRSLDDGIEMFGGTVDLKNIVISGAGDDSIDWDWGWTGRVQFAVIQQHPDIGDNAFEGDNNGDNHDASPRSEPTFYNITLAGAGLSPRQHRGIVVREGSGGHFHNMIVDSYAIETIDTRDDVSPLVNSGRLTFSNNLLANTGQFGRSPTESGNDNDDFSFNENDWLRAPGNNNHFRMESAVHDSARDLSNPSFRARVQMRQMHAAKPPQSEFFDESAVFQGALNPLATKSWLAGWTGFPDA
ncbi:hypothetical protein [Marinobacter zhejiangensis]|uniref:Right handed beta helix region n=1 Tax=Marinobacter zhejiangensis TaxID=488535 RepID=A0A1I4MHP3_9GAMM|nr:hypothetical protein [Marinobacter zhejiangensis]SFM02533.1 hypothetical protein SAMN04487963_1084 [Marinobacter zhejiangensis]